MDRYGADYRWGSTGRYGREYEQWGARNAYDQDFGFRGSRAGSFYDRDFSGYQPRDFGGRSTQRFQPGYSGPWNQRYDRGFRASQMRGQGSHGPDWHEEERVMRQRSYPSPWNESHPGQNFGFGLGYGQGRGQFIYK